MANSTKEIWKQIPFPKNDLQKKYAVSSLGRIASFEKDLKDLYILKTTKTEGYDCITMRMNGKSSSVFIHKAMAMAFLNKKSINEKIVLHLDFNKNNNDLSNLKWATAKEAANHVKNSPNVLKANKHKIPTGTMAKKLNDKSATLLKKEIWNPKRKLSLGALASKYGIAEMNLYRIKAGLLWTHIRVEGEPEWPKYKEYLKNVEYHARKNQKIEIEKAKRATVRSKIESERKTKLAEKLKATKLRLLTIARNKAKREAAKKIAQINRAKKTKKNLTKKVALKKAKSAPKKTNFTLVKVTKKRKK